jgi:hypothetical protein
MFTVEEDFDETVVTVLDSHGVFQDVKMFFSEESVIITQIMTDDDEYVSVIEMSDRQWEKLILAYSRTAGSYRTIPE